MGSTGRKVLGVLKPGSMAVLRVVLAGCAVLLGGRAAQGQTAASWDPGRPNMTRAALEDLLARYEQATASPGYTEEMRERARYEASLIRARLEEGDFQVGDRILLVLEGEEQLSDTFAVAPGPALLLPVVGEIPLKGVLRSELEDHIREHLTRFYRNPVVRARALIRIEVYGEVTRPGFYVLAPETPVTDLLMRAGGMTREADQRSIRVERGDRTIWGAEALRQAIIEARTLDQLSVRAGDRLVVPRKSTWSLGEMLRVGAFVLPSVVTLVTLLR
ncbi:MAG TPA: SLBB domain-containing protein [Longimicrobiales bacterium]